MQKDYPNPIEFNNYIKDRFALNITGQNDLEKVKYNQNFYLQFVCL